MIAAYGMMWKIFICTDLVINGWWKVS